MDEEVKRLLFLDDEPNILSALERVFFDDDYEIVTFENGRDALDYLEDNTVQIIISDQRMPEMTGSEFCGIAREVQPDSIRMILTGYADLEAAVEAINDGQIYKFMFKPWNDDELRTTVQRALDFYDLSRENESLLAEVLEKNAQLEEFNKKLAQKVKERTAVIVQKNLELGRNNKKLELSLIGTVKVFVRLMDVINPVVSGHSRRVASIATTIAKQVGLEVKQIQNIEIAALLHDVGKLGIPQNVLEKDLEKLTEKERSAIINHPMTGESTLAEIQSFERVCEIIRHHHERWDGNGYPDRLAGENIPEEARLISVCNEYDHLASDPAKPRSATFIQKFFQNNSGVRFDPKYVQAVLSLIIQMGEKEEAGRELEVLPHELEPGMILANNLQTEKGIFLLPEGQILKDSHIQSILDIHEVDPVSGSIRVIVPNEEAEG